MQPIGTKINAEYTPHGLLREVFSRRDDEILVAGPAGTGKSMACLQKLHAMALMNPGMRGLIVRKTLVSLGSTALVTWREHVIKEAEEAGIVKFYGGSASVSPMYKYTNGSQIVIGGMDKAIRIMSSEYDIVYAQEATELEENDWESINSRLRHGIVSFQQLLADCNPAQPTHWLKKRCEEGKTVMLESRHEDNPILFDEDGVSTERGTAYMRKLDALTGVRYLRLRKGLWAAAEGLIYENWDPSVHLVDPFKIPEEWPRFWSVDFGYVNPFVCQMWAEDPDGRLVLYREIYQSKRTVDELAKDIMASCSRIDYRYRHPPGENRLAHQGRLWTEPRPVAIVCDHDAEGRAVLQRELGMSTVPAHKAVSEGLQAVDKRMGKPEDRGRGGKPRIMIMRGACVKRDPILADLSKPTCTADEIVGYIWDTGAGKKIKEDPLKEDDHGCDGMRYVVAYRDLGGRPRVRTM